MTIVAVRRTLWVLDPLIENRGLNESDDCQRQSLFFMFCCVRGNFGVELEILRLRAFGPSLRMTGVGVFCGGYSLRCVYAGPLGPYPRSKDWGLNESG